MKEVEEIFRLLRFWKPKGELIYRLRQLGVSWKRIKEVCPSCESLCSRWANQHGRDWPL